MESFVAHDVVAVLWRTLVCAGASSAMRSAVVAVVITAAASALAAGHFPNANNNKLYYTSFKQIPISLTRCSILANPEDLDFVNYFFSVKKVSMQTKVPSRANKRPIPLKYPRQISKRYPI